MGAGIERFVGTHIDGAYGDGQPVHILHRALVSGKLLFLIRQIPATPHEQKLAAKKPYAQRPSFERHLRVFGHFDIS